MGGFTYIPFLLTGDPYYLEEMQFCDLFALIINLPSSRGHFYLTQPRGWAWSLRTRMQLAKVTPASVPAWLLPKSYYTTWLNTQRDYAINTHVNATDPKTVARNAALHVIMAADLNLNPIPPIPANTYHAPWEQDFIGTIVGWTVLMGNADWMPIHNYCIQHALGRSAGTSGWPRAQPTNYQIQMRPSGGASVTASISGTTMTVTAIAAGGNLVDGQPLSSTGTAPNVAAGTTVVSQLNSTETNGAVGLKGTYQVSISQTVASKTITGAAMPFVADWGAAWQLRRKVYGLTGPDPATLAIGDQTYPSYLQGDLAVANGNGVPGALAAYQWLHGQLVARGTTSPSDNHVRYKWAIAEV